MPVIVDCHSCGRKLRITEELLGRKVQCPSCGQTFDAESPPPEPSPETNGYGGGNGTPSAVEPASRLGSDRDQADEEDDRPWERPPSRQVRRDCEPERGGFILTMGIISLLLPVLGIALGLAAWIMGVKDLRKIRKGQMDPQGHGTTMAGMICGIIGLVIQLLFSLCIGLYVMFIVMMIQSIKSAVPPPRPAFTAPATAKFPEDEGGAKIEEGIDPDRPRRMEVPQEKFEEVPAPVPPKPTRRPRR